MKLILFEGEDIYLKKKYLDKIKKEFNNLKKGVNYFKYEKIDFDDLKFEVEMPSFLDEKKLIILEDERYFKTSEKTFKDFTKYLEEDIWNIDVILVLIYTQKLRDTNKLKKILLKKGEIKNISKPSENILRKEILEKLKKENIEINYQDLAYFIQSVGLDLYTCINEIDKIVSYLKYEKREKINKEDIDKIVNKTVDSKMFEITKVLEIGQNKKAIQIINENFKDKTEILGLISYLYTYYWDIYLSKIALKSNINPQSILNLPPNRAFLVNIYKKIAGKLELKKIKYILDELSRIDLLAKSENTDTLILLKALIIYI